jgi:hypothetical protein
MSDKILDDDDLKRMSVGFPKTLSGMMATELLSLRHPAPCVCGKWVADTPFCPYCGHPIKAKGERDEVKYWRHKQNRAVYRSTINRHGENGHNIIMTCIDEKGFERLVILGDAIREDCHDRVSKEEYERAKTPAPIFVAGAGAARLAGVDIEPAVDEAWINVPDYPGSSNKIQRAIEQLQRRIEALGLKNK